VSQNQGTLKNEYARSKIRRLTCRRFACWWGLFARVNMQVPVCFLEQRQRHACASSTDFLRASTWIPNSLAHRHALLRCAYSLVSPFCHYKHYLRAGEYRTDDIRITSTITCCNEFYSTLHIVYRGPWSMGGYHANIYLNLIIIMSI
jgi:hypothetical protein